MLLACSRCHRQYDVGAHPEGARVRCLCGELNTVPEARARRVEMLHCSTCGGRLEGASAPCPYCSAEPKLADRGLGPACPECFATTLAGARHCGACGVRLAPEAVLRALGSRQCPRCKHALSECESSDARWVECTGCGGLWLDEELFQRVARERDGAVAAAVKTREPGAQVTASADTPVRYLACPVCAQVMHRRNFASCSGVVLDWCRGHGWWFDPHELERVLAFIEGGGLDKARRREVEAREEDFARRERRLSREAAALARSGLRRERPQGAIERLVEFLLHLS